MQQRFKMKAEITRIRRYTLFLALAWTVTLSTSFAWLYNQEKRNILEIARAAARVAFEKDVLYRTWASSHGGVYVPVDERTPPNPYLSHIPEREVATPSGRLLTLINPAYMTRQVFEMAEREQAVTRGHITSLKPINPGNRPDPWETRALTALAKGQPEFSEQALMEGKPYLRLMRPFTVQKPCLKCHAAQGYHVGDLRGGISVSIPLGTFSGYTGKLLSSAATAYGVIWLLGLLALYAGSRALSGATLAIAKSEERYRTVADFTSAWEYWQAPDGTFLYVSPSCRSVCGYSQEDFYRDPGLLDRLIHPLDLPGFQKASLEAAQGGTVEMDFRICARDGETRWIAHSARAVVGSDGANNGRRASNRDITPRVLAEQRLHEQTMMLEEEVAERQATQETLQEQARALEEEMEERRKAQEAARASEERFSKAFQRAPLIMSIMRASDGVFLDVNDRFTELTGYTREETVGKTAAELSLFPELDSASISQISFRNEFAPTSQRPLLTKDHRSLCCEQYAENITVGGQRCILAIALDISEQKSLEEQLRHAQKLDAVGQLAGGIAHDFNNILTVILGHGNLMELMLPADAPVRENLGQMMVAADRASQLTRSLLTFSRKQVMNLQVCDINDIIHGMHTFLLRVIGEQVRLRTDFHDPELRVSVDRGQIEQVLMNLITNARDAMPNGGEITVEAGAVSLEGRPAGKPGAYALIAVSDTGTGMDEDTRSRIFEPFFTTKATGKGTGLGMSIVHGIITQHGGSIELASAPGKGSRFSVYLPLCSSDGRDAVRPLVEDSPKGGSETILVAEDEQAVRTLMEAILTQQGYRVVTACDGADAVVRYRAAGESVKLAILDLVMPGKSGREAFEEIRRMDPKLRVLFCSGYSSDIISSHDLGSGTDLLVKPVHPTTLLRKVRHMLDAPEAGEDAAAT